TPYLEIAKELQAYKKFQEAVHESEELYYNTLVQINKSVSAQLRILPKIPKVITSIDQKAAKFKSQRLDVLSNKLQLQYNHLTGNYQANVKLCTYLEKKYFQHSQEEVKIDLDKKKIAFNKLFAF